MPVIVYENLKIIDHVVPFLSGEGVTVVKVTTGPGSKNDEYKRNTSNMIVYLRNGAIVIRANGDSDAQDLADEIVDNLKPFGDELTVYLYL